MKIKRIIPLLIIVLLLVFAQSAYAATYSYDLGKYYGNYGMSSYSVSDIDLLGINKTQGFTQKILGTISSSYSSGSGGRWSLTLNYTVPDDGSTWQIVGTVQIMVSYSDYEGGFAGSYISNLVNVNQTVTTSGTFIGVSIGQAVNAANAANTAAGQAKMAADNANTAASNAATNVLNAYNSVNNSNGNTITAVRDASGTVLSEARQAKTNSQNASTYASQASTNALNAYNTAQTVNTKIDSLSTAVTNIQNNMGADTSPPVVNLTTLSGARATSGNSIKIVVGVSDNISNTFTYSLNDSTYQSLPADRIVTVPVNGFDAVHINVWVRDEAGNTGTGFIAIRKL